MAVIFNATTTTTGLQISSDSSGAFQFETNGANTVSISNTGTITSNGFSGNLVSTSGGILIPPSTGTVTIPAGTGTAAVQGVSTNIVQGTSQASTSGTTITFTGIPAYAKRITIIFNGISTNGNSNYLIQIGSGSITSTGYVSASISAQSNAQSSAGVTSTTGFIVTSAISATYLFSGFIYLLNISGNTWVENATIVDAIGDRAESSSGNVTLSGSLDRVRITTVNGADAFDAGSVNILYE